MERRTDLDWLRIIAFALLILYHVGCFYSLEPWHARSIHASSAIEPILLITTPWRIPLLFVISGVATRFMLDKMPAGAFVASRAIRLLIPFAFALLVIVPPQTYIELLERGGYHGSYLEFYARTFTIGRWHMGEVSIAGLDWAHLWFVAYLFAMTMLIVPLAGPFKRFSTSHLAPLLRGWLIFAVPMAVLLVFAFLITPWLFAISSYDVTTFVQACAFFVFGYLVAKHDAFFEQCRSFRWIALAAAVTAYLVTVTSNGQHATVERLMHDVQCWSAIIAAFGFARQHLRHDGPTRRYLTEAVFPYYIIHQTVLVIGGHYLTLLHLPVWIEAPVLIAGVAASCAIGYEIVRRVWFLRPLFGLKLAPRGEKKLAAA